MLKDEVKEITRQIRECFDGSWTRKEYEAVWKLIGSGAEESYAVFSSKLLPEIASERVIGVRLPDLRRYAEAIVKKDPQGYLKEAFAWNQDHVPSLEENLMTAFVIGRITDWSEAKPWIEKFLPLIDNWSVNDSFCTSLKVAKKEGEEVWKYLLECVESEKPYTIRFALVMMLNYYIKDEYIDDVLAICDRSTWKGYYVQMAAAWLLSMCYVTYPEKTLEVMLRSSLDDFTYHKTIQKIVESRQVTSEQKEMIKTYRRG